MNSISIMLVNGEEYNIYPLNSNNGVGKLLDISSMSGTLNKVEFTEKFLQENFVNDTLDGVIIKRGYSYDNFEELRERFISNRFEYQPNGGLVLIVEYQTVGIGQAECVSDITYFLNNVNNLYNTRVLKGYHNVSIPVIEGGISFGYVPDQCFIPIGRVGHQPTMVIEVAVTRSTTNLINKFSYYSSNKNIEMGIGIRLFPKENDETSKLIAFVFTRVNGVLTCTCIVSFGSCRTTEQDDANYLELTNNVNNNVLCGVLSTNNLINNTPNTPPFIINIPLNVLLKGANPQPQPLHPCKAESCFIDLNTIRESLDSINAPFTAIIHDYLFVYK